MDDWEEIVDETEAMKEIDETVSEDYLKDTKNEK